MATSGARQASPIGNALVLANKNDLGIVAPQGLERPLSSLADNVQRAMGAFYDVHKALMVSRNTPKNGMEQFKQAKHVFRTECETLRQVLQSGYRHAVDFSTSCQRAPNDRFISAKRCQLSGKAVLRDLQGVIRAYDRNVEEFRTQQPVLTEYLIYKSKKGDQPSSVDIEHDPAIHPEAAVSTLYAVLEDLQSSLRDILAFWDNHTAFLTLVVNRQSNFPAPGEETKATVELWARYQAAILQSSSSISQSADAMSVDPSIVTLNGKARRRHTHPAIDADRRPDQHSPEHETKHDVKSEHSLPFPHRLAQWLKRVFHLES